MKHMYLLLTILALTGCLYENHPVTYRVYYLNGNATSGQPPSDSRRYETGDAVTLNGRGTLQCNDYTFLGWRYNEVFHPAGDRITIQWEDINLYPVWDDGLDGPFMFKIENNEAIIITYTEYYAASVTVPDTLQGKPVTAIGNNAFSNISMSEVVLPKNLKRIGIGAFATNTIKHIIIPASVESIGVNAFCNNTLRKLSFMGTGPTEIAPYTFAWNELSDITLPAGITTIGTGAFHENKITQITIGAGVNIQDDTALGVNGPSFRALYDTGKQAGLYIYTGNDTWDHIE